MSEWQNKLSQLLRLIDKQPNIHKFRRKFDSSNKKSRLEGQIKNLSDMLFSFSINTELINETEPVTYAEKKRNKKLKSITPDDRIINWLNNGNITLTFGGINIKLEYLGDEKDKEQFITSLINLVSCFKDLQSLPETIKSIPKVGRKKLKLLLDKIKNIDDKELMKLIDQIPKGMLKDLVEDEGVKKMAEGMERSTEIERLVEAVKRRRADIEKKLE